MKKIIMIVSALIFLSTSALAQQGQVFLALIPCQLESEMLNEIIVKRKMEIFSSSSGRIVAPNQERNEILILNGEIKTYVQYEKKEFITVINVNMNQPELISCVIASGENFRPGN